MAGISEPSTAISVPPSPSNPARQTRNKIRDLERLNPGMKVTLVPIGTAA